MSEVAPPVSVRRDDRRRVTTNAAEILVIADAMACNLILDRATVFTIPLQDGFAEVTGLLRSRKLVIARFEVVVLLIGRGDLWEPDHKFKLEVNKCLAEVRQLNPRCTLILTATLPNPSDSLRVVRTAIYRNGYLSTACT